MSVLLHLLNREDVKLSPVTFFSRLEPELVVWKTSWLDPGSTEQHEHVIWAVTGTQTQGPSVALLLRCCFVIFE